MSEPDMVNHPPHYTTHPSGVECIQITEHMGFNLGNAVKYIWRADEKGNSIQDLEKARWYVEREIAKRTGQLTLEAQLTQLRGELDKLRRDICAHATDTVFVDDGETAIDRISHLLGDGDWYNDVYLKEEQTDG